jgi:chitinase
VRVKVAGDDLHEKTETFRLELSNPAGLTIADGSALCTIADDDPPKRRSARH